MQSDAGARRGAAHAPVPAAADAARRRRVTATLAVAALVLTLFPPLQWWLADGDKAVTVAYFLLSGLFVVGSVVAIARLDTTDDLTEDER